MTVPELLEWLGGNRFLSAPQVEELRGQLASFTDAHALAKELIQRNWLTPYQVNQILQGKGDLLIVGANRLRERIGEGAIGQVFKAWNTRLERIVAVKMIHKEHLANSRAMDRFQREMQSASQLDHPNIVLVRDAGEADDRPYLVMDFVEGTDLSQRVKQTGPLPLGEAVSYAQQAAVGLQHAFERGVIHRDIKPGNLLVTKAADQSALVKILDFGLARLDTEMHCSARLTHAGNLIGTVDYIAPEQALDAHTADVRADLYSLGCTLYYLLAGKPPFPGATLVEKITARTSSAPPSVREARPEVPAGLDAVIQRLMARQPEDRYQTPQEAALALAPFTRLTSVEHVTATFDQTDLAAALTARQLAQAVPAQAVPVTEIMPAGIATVMAVPVVQAFPVMSAVEATAEGHGEPFGFGDDAPVAIATAMPVAQATASIPSAAPARRSNAWLFFGGVIAVVAIAAVAIAMTIRGSRPASASKTVYGPGAALTILPLEPHTFKEGDSKFVIVKIQRKEFKGPVELTVEALPDGIRAQTITFSDNQDTAQFRLTVSFTTRAMKTNLRVVAKAENLQAETLLPLTVVTNRNVAVPD